MQGNPIVAHHRPFAFEVRPFGQELLVQGLHAFPLMRGKNHQEIAAQQGIVGIAIQGGVGGIHNPASAFEINDGNANGRMLDD